MKLILSFYSMLFALVLFAEKKPLEYYQPIVDANPFGPPPPGFDPNVLPNDPSLKGKSSSRDEKKLTQEQEKLKASISFSVINKTEDGNVAVGFTDNGDPKAPRHYYLKVGEERDGWKVDSADPVEGSMILIKEGMDPIELTIGSSSDAKGKAPTAAAAMPQRRPALMGGMNGRPGVGMGSLRDRRMNRERERQESAAAEAKRQEEAKAAQAEREAREAEEKAQREQERAEQREQLERIKEELKRVRESKKDEVQKDESASEGEPIEI